METVTSVEPVSPASVVALSVTPAAKAGAAMQHAARPIAATPPAMRARTLFWYLFSMGFPSLENGSYRPGGEGRRVPCYACAATPGASVQETVAICWALLKSALARASLPAVSKEIESVPLPA